MVVEDVGVCVLVNQFSLQLRLLLEILQLLSYLLSSHLRVKGIYSLEFQGFASVLEDGSLEDPQVLLHEYLDVLVDNGLLPLAGQVLVKGLDQLIVLEEVNLVLS